MKIKIIFLILQISIINLQFIFVQSQTVQQEWVRTYVGPDNLNTFPEAMYVDSSGNSIITGMTNRSSGRQDYCTIKYNSQGSQQWVAMYDGIPTSNGTNDPLAVTEDSYGNVYTTGRSQRTGINSDDYCTIKYNSQGVQQWVSRYDGYNGNNDAWDIELDPALNVYITGESTNTLGKYEITTIKYNNNGVQQWVRRYTPDSTYDCMIRSLAVDNLGNVFIGGSGGGGYNNYIILIKYNSSGVQQWITLTNMGGYGGGIGRIKLDDTGYIYLTGDKSDTIRLNSSWHEFTKFLTMQYNSSGVEQWVSFYHNINDTTSDDYSCDMVIDSSRNVFIVGKSMGSNNQEDFTTIKYNFSGVQQWIKKYNRNTTEISIPTIALDYNSNVYITGTIWDNNYYNFATIKYNVNSVQQWMEDYPGGSGTRYQGRSHIGLDSRNNVYVTGGSNSSPQMIVTIKYNQLNGIKKISDNIPLSYRLFQNYPNPFNPSTNIKYEVPYSTNVKITIFDILGHKVQTLIDEHKEAGQYEAIFNGLNYPSGIYFYEIKAIFSQETKKMIILK